MRTIARFSAILVSFAVLGGSVYGITHRQAIQDYLALQNYSPSVRIAALADDTTMKDATRRVFYINHPELNDKSEFRRNCLDTERSIVLGCYIENNGIYLLDVADQRLNGMIQVTAAHEVLHAEYDRLSDEERSRVDRLTDDFFAGMSDERIKTTIEQYRAEDPSKVPGELHSILGTEVRTLSTELESYYSRYFADRSQIVKFSENYEQTFVDLDNQVKKYDEQLESLKETIESNRVEIEGQSNEIELQKSRLDALLNSDRTDEYNAAVPAFNAEVGSHNRLLERTRSLIAEYNEIVEKRNAIVTTEQELVEAIDSNVVPKAQ